MDILGSIMSSMDKPPSLSEKEKLILKKRKEEKDKRIAEEKEQLGRFKEWAEKTIEKHFDNPEAVMLKFKPMDHIYRSIVHEAAESAGLLSYAFGIEGVDRYVRIYRKDNPPCEEEMLARRRGDPWNEQIRQEMMEKKRLERIEEKESAKKAKEFVPNSNYKDKYAHLIGQDAALDAARKAETNKSYGIVPSENKKDIRSIEQTMADIRAKKRLKTEQQQLQQKSTLNNSKN